jgi:hypothetical protein
MRNLQMMTKRFSTIAGIVLLAFTSHCQPARSENDRVSHTSTTEKKQSIMLALLLDTSNSMDGLIDQAKSQLWKIVNELAAAKCDDGSKPSIKIALYEYGNDGLPESEGYIRQVSPLTTDLDVLSEKLFSLTTNGGNEFCGKVINTSLHQLDWSESKADLKIIFIAGNEPFTQGTLSYQVACGLAREKGVVVNTIFCGNFDEGLNSQWKSGADITGGSYMSIDQNRKTVYINTPYDDKISALNGQLNNTYVSYGVSGKSKKALQSNQDSNAGAYGNANMVERTVAKSSSAYSNESWDLVDAYKKDDKIVDKVAGEALPEEMKTMTVDQRKNYVKQKMEERNKIQMEIAKLQQQRIAYLNTNTSTSGDAALESSMIKAIKVQAKSKNLSF